MSPSLIKFGSDMQDQNPAIQPYRWFKILPYSHAAVQLRDLPPFQKHKPCLCIATFHPKISSTQVHFQFLQPKFSHATIYLYNCSEYLLYVAAICSFTHMCWFSPHLWIPQYPSRHQRRGTESKWHLAEYWSNLTTLRCPTPKNMVPCETLGKDVTSWQLPEQTGMEMGEPKFQTLPEKMVYIGRFLGDQIPKVFGCPGQILYVLPKKICLIIAILIWKIIVNHGNHGRSYMSGQKNLRLNPFVAKLRI